MPFRIVRLEVTENAEVIARQVTQPFYELRAHAAAMAERAAAHCDDTYRYDAESDSWCALDRGKRRLRFVVEPVALGDDMAA